MTSSILDLQTAATLATWFERGVEANQAGRYDEAEAAFKAALAIDPEQDEAHFGLGLCRMGGRRFGDAVEPLRRSAANQPTEPVRLSCLGQALYMTGAFEESARAFDLAARQAPLPANAGLTWARARTFAAIIDGEAEIALLRYPSLAGPDAEDVDALAQEALSIFGVFDQIEAARAVGRWLVARHPNDRVLAYRVQVLEGAPLARAPTDYVEAHFDAFADRFDQQLEGLLDYKAPQRLADLLALRRDRFETILDLGCGTGLAASALARFGGQLTGVDLSARMLTKARERGAYDSLVQADAVPYLRGQAGRFDLIFAADVLIYFGDLSELFVVCAAALRRDGYLAVSTEIAPEGWSVLSSGRFAHARAYVVDQAGSWFEVVDQTRIGLRREGLAEIAGELHLLRLRS
jgi:predicted TPR repeat methyltransferase